MYPETRLSSELGDGSPVGWQAGKGEAIQYFESEVEFRRNLNTPKLDPKFILHKGAVDDGVRLYSPSWYHVVEGCQSHPSHEGLRLKHGLAPTLKLALELSCTFPTINTGGPTPSYLRL